MVDAAGALSTLRRELSWGALVVLLAFAALPWGPDAGSPVAMRCSRAVIVGGALRCDADAPVDVAGLCGPGHPEASRAIYGGDVVDPVALCTRGATAGLTRMAPEDLAALAQPTDVNAADGDELDGLPGIGPALAARVIEARPFADVDDLVRVRGIGPVTVERLRPRVVARPSPPP